MAENQQNGDAQEDAHDQADSHSHHADDYLRSSATRLSLAAAANIAFAIVQVAAGLAIGSVVVLADAAHQAVDALGLVTALVALQMARRPADEQWTYGLGKSDALGGFVSALLLVLSVVWIVWESSVDCLLPKRLTGGASS